MDADIRVAEQLAEDAEHCLASFAAKTQLWQVRFDFLEQEERDAKEEEADLRRRTQELKAMEATHKREAASLREQLAAKSAQFQELTRLQSEGLLERALKMETALLRGRIQELQAEEQRLQRLHDKQTPAVTSHLAAAAAIQQECKEVFAEHKKLLEEVQRSFVVASVTLELETQEEAAERDYCRILEEAIEDMTFQQVDEKLLVQNAVDAGRDGTEDSSQQVQQQLARLTMLRDQEESQFSRLEEVLKGRVDLNNQLATDLECCSDRIGDGSDTSPSADQRAGTGPDRADAEVTALSQQVEEIVGIDSQKE